MQIDSETYKKMPQNLKRLFVEVPDEVEVAFAAFGESKSSNNSAEIFRRSESISIAKNGMNKIGKSMGARKGHSDSGTASRFFFSGKASKKDRDEGCEELTTAIKQRTMAGGLDTRGRPIPINYNFHPTVKPTALMRYLCRLITPPDGLILDPFMGSGSTGKAAMREGFDFIGIELSPEYCTIAEQRIKAAIGKPELDNTPIKPQDHIACAGEMVMQEPQQMRLF